MREEDIVDGMLQLDDKLLLENRFCRKRRKVTWVRWVLLVIILTIFILGIIARYTVPDSERRSYFDYFPSKYYGCEDFTR